MKRAAAIAAALLLTGCAAETPVPDDGKLHVTFAETGKSDFILIQADGCTVINDTAYYENSAQIAALLKERGTEHIDLVILSHYDKDHIGGAANLLRNFDVDRIAMPDCFGGSEYWLDMMTVLKNSDTEQIVLSEDADFNFGEVSIHISTAKQEYPDENDMSMITEIAYGDTRFLLTGDAQDARMAEYAAEMPSDARADVIKLPHHGSYSKALGGVIETLSPQFAVITSNDDRETVSKKTLKALEAAECQALYTDEGDIELVSDGLTVTLAP